MWLVGSTRPAISLRPVSRLLMKSGRWVGRWLVSGGITRPLIRIRPVSRLLMKSGRRVGRWLVSGGITRPVISVLKILFLVGPGRYGSQRAGTRVLAPMGDNRRFYKNLHIYKLKTYINNRIQPFALYLVGHVFCIQNSTTQKKC